MRWNSIMLVIAVGNTFDFVYFELGKRDSAWFELLEQAAADSVKRICLSSKDCIWFSCG